MQGRPFGRRGATRPHADSLGLTLARLLLNPRLGALDTNADEPDRTGERRLVEDFDVSQSKMAESAQRVVERAVEESRRRDHALLTNEHVFLAFAQIEWDMFSQVMRDLDLNPYQILQALEEHLKMIPALSGRDLRPSPATKLLFKLAFHHASRAGRQSIESVDLFSAIFEESQGIPVSVIRGHGVEPELLISRIATRMRDMELRDERLRKHFELPPFLKHFATNLNQLARQDRIPPVYGRDHEIQQVLEILCHRERANSVMLIGEPGVGKTAIVEGLARKVEFEPAEVPVRLRDVQVVNLQMNTMVAGTMLRGMFEDRIQNVIREIKEHPNLILFVDEVHTMIGDTIKLPISQQWKEGSEFHVLGRDGQIVVEPQGRIEVDDAPVELVLGT